MRKKLLSEAQVRRFQSLAQIKPLNEMYGSEPPMEEEEPMIKEEEMEMNDEEPEMDEADVTMDEELVQKFLDAVDTMQEVAGVLNGGAATDGMDDMDAVDDEGMDDLAPAPEEGEEEPMLDAGEDEGGEEPEMDEKELQEALRGINYVPSQKEVVKVVAQRVARRLQEAKRAEAQLNKALGKRR